MIESYRKEIYGLKNDDIDKEFIENYIDEPFIWEIRSFK